MENENLIDLYWFYVPERLLVKDDENWVKTPNGIWINVDEDDV